MRYFSRIQFINLTQWKYSCEDNTITTEYLTPFWNSLLCYVPTWVSPNVITLLGLVHIIIALWIAENIYSPIFIPIICFLLFMSLTLDALDGKQARRMNRSSPLGELLDHVVDSFSLQLVIRISQIIFEVKNDMLHYYYIGAALAFTCTHYEAMIKKRVIFHRYAGPNEFYFLIFALYHLHHLVGIGHLLDSTFIASLFFIAPFLRLCYIFHSTDINWITSITKTFWIITFIYVGAVYLSPLFNLNYINYACAFSILNNELIISKMSRSVMKYKLVLFVLGNLIMRAHYAVVFFLIYVVIVFGELKMRLKINFF